MKITTKASKRKNRDSHASREKGELFCSKACWQLENPPDADAADNRAERDVCGTAVCKNVDGGGAREEGGGCDGTPPHGVRRDGSLIVPENLLSLPGESGE